MVLDVFITSDENIKIKYLELRIVESEGIFYISPDELADAVMRVKKRMLKDGYFKIWKIKILGVICLVGVRAELKILIKCYK